MPLSLQAQALIDMVYRVGAARFHELTPAQARHSFQKLQFAFRPDAPAVASVTEVPIGRSDGSVLLARYYRPVQARPEQRLPLLVFFHGGGWCVGDVESYDVLCRELANGAGVAVLSVDYRLAPEHPFPAAVDDARLAVEWAAAHADLLNVDPLRFALGGDSAGGNLSVVTALALRDEDNLKPVFLALIYPSTEIVSERASRQAFGNGYFLDTETLDWFFTRYLPHGDTEDWRISPMRAASLAGLPPTLIVTAECDPLIDDCEAFAERLAREGGAVDVYRAAGVVHGFITLGKFFPEAQAAIGRVTVSLRARMADLA
ncbi:alpha/beta hydrolase [Azoarcus sp. L1K30]|uniref:alpha/beta hydrolase n=1 Tax=Azoarcus sp. L1K30 TaxID=2820277 RepID=UPI001B831B51|nr:alpha/beta hydrolase [Azoarcus sp. L1K30]MBR0566281.1 alpha/beta hydrolase [Azoarcus sp. L1K30]